MNRESPVLNRCCKLCRRAVRRLVGALRAARASFQVGPELLAALPIAGRDGTLRKRAEGAYGFGDGHPFGPDRIYAFWRETHRQGLDRRVQIRALGSGAAPAGVPASGGFMVISVTRCRGSFGPPRGVHLGVQLVPPSVHPALTTLRARSSASRAASPG